MIAGWIGSRQTRVRLRLEIQTWIFRAQDWTLNFYHVSCQIIPTK